MATGDINNKSAKKHIRFPHELVQRIEALIELEKESNPNSNFSAWVLDACEKKVKVELDKLEHSSIVILDHK